MALGGESERSRTKQRPIIRLVSLVESEFREPGAFGVAVRESVAWLANRTHSHIPEDAFEGKPFELTREAAQPCTAVSGMSDGSRVWAARLIDADRSVAQRSWIAEIVVVEGEASTTHVTRLTNVTRGQEDPPFTASIAGVVRQVIAKIACFDGCLQISDSPRVVESAESLDYGLFVQALFDPSRRLPIVTVSRPEGGDALLNGSVVAGRLCGAAHVFEISNEVGWKLTDEFGRRFSTFGGAVRQYCAPINPKEIYPFEHPLLFPDRFENASEILDIVVDRAIKSTLRPVATNRTGVRFDDIRRAQLLQSGTPNERDVIEDLRKELEGERKAAEQILDDHVRLTTDYRKQIDEQQDKLEELANWLQGMRRRGLLVAAPLLSYDEIALWANTELAPDVVVTAKAVRETEKTANFHDIVLFQEALLLLKNYYAPMRKNPTDQRLYRQFRDACKRFPIEETQVLKNLKDADKLDPRYFVMYKGKRRLCERHLKYRANDWNPTTSFRIYFFWDEATQKVVIGHMPTHLDNWKS
jgi:hypothetical protein